MFCPSGDTRPYDGVSADLWSPSDEWFFTGAPPDKVPVGVPNARNAPSPNPNERFDSMTYQIRTFQISDVWYASVPSQTWPNRAFLQAGTSNRNVNDGNAELGAWDVDTIFTVLERAGESWRVQSDMWGGILLVRDVYLELTAFELGFALPDFDRLERDFANDALPA